MKKYIFLFLLALVLPFLVNAEFPAVKVISPVGGNVWRINSQHKIVISGGLSVNFPQDNTVIISLDKLNRQRFGIIDCIKKADNRSNFAWKIGITKASCGASTAKDYKAIVPGKYRVTFREDGPGNKIIGQSGLFQIKGVPVNVKNSLLK